MKLDLTMFASNNKVSKNEFAQIEKSMENKYNALFSNGKNKVHQLVKFTIGKFEYVTTIEAFEILIERKLVTKDSLISKFNANILYFESNQKDQIYCANNINKKELKDFRDLGNSQYKIIKTNGQFIAKLQDVTSCLAQKSK
jgi:uncharacterized protein (UPF0297 family)